MLAGKDEPVTKGLIQFANEMGGYKKCTIVGHGIKLAPNQAGLINGAAAHAMDFDDTLADFWGHPSASLFASLLALGELEKKSSRI